MVYLELRDFVKISGHAFRGGLVSLAKWLEDLNGQGYRDAVSSIISCKQVCPPIS